MSDDAVWMGKTRENGGGGERQRHFLGFLKTELSVKWLHSATDEQIHNSTKLREVGL